MNVCVMTEAKVAKARPQAMHCVEERNRGEYASYLARSNMPLLNTCLGSNGAPVLSNVMYAEIGR